MAAEQYQAKYRTRAEIRRRGAIGNLQDGITIETQGVATRPIAWPATGYQTEAVHVLTLAPGDQTREYTYGVAEEAMLCLAGRGEVLVRGRWCGLQPGDIAYFPEGVAHALRNPDGNADDLVVVTQISPPQFDLYEAAGYYDRSEATMNLTAAFKAALNAHRTPIPTGQMGFHDDDADVRVQNLTAADVRHGGALFNVYLGTPFAALGIPGRLVLWPAAGTRSAGFNFALAPALATDNMHIHPVADECLVVWEGTCEGYTAEGYTGSEFIALDTYDVILAPCGVLHGHRSTDTPSVLGGFASPPQLDLLLDSGFYDDGVFLPATFERLDTAEVPGLDQLRTN